MLEGDEGSAAGAVEDLRDIEGEGAVGVDRLEACRAEMGDGLLADVVPVGAVSFDRVVQVPSGGQDARVLTTRVWQCAWVVWSSWWR